MRILVPIKQVPETGAVKMDEATGTMLREGVEAIINPLDLYGIELAIQLQERVGGETVCISMGPPKAELALREAVAMGIGSGVLLSDRQFAGADTWATAYTLSRGVAKLGPCDLIVCGERATDGDTGQVGPALAAFLGLPVASYVSKIEAIDGNTIRARRLLEGGCERVDVRLPCVLTVVKEVSNPRLPTLRGKQRARQAVVPVWTAADIDADPTCIGLNGSPTRVVKIHKPKIARTCEKRMARDEESIGVAVDELLAFLAGKGLIG